MNAPSPPREFVRPWAFIATALCLPGLACPVHAASDVPVTPVSASRTPATTATPATPITSPPASGGSNASTSAGSSATSGGAATSGASDAKAAAALGPIVVTAPEPRYVAPTRRDQIGRIWAPVIIDGQGPFRLVLDSGATTSGITSQVARQLGLPVDGAHRVMLRGVVGAVPVPLVHIQSMTVGDLTFGTRDLPIVTDALGGADGILGTDGMEDRRILIDFNHDLIQITRSHNEPAPPNYVTIPFNLEKNELMVADAWVGNVQAKAIIDTGGQVTIANLALQRALKEAEKAANPENIEDVTQETQRGDAGDTPPILLGTAFSPSTIKITMSRITFADMHIFQHWEMVDQPAMLIGMDTLGQLSMLIIDYRRHELQMLLEQ